MKLKKSKAKQVTSLLNIIYKLQKANKKLDKAIKEIEWLQKNPHIHLWNYPYYILKRKINALHQIDYKKLAFGGYWHCLCGLLTGLLLIRFIQEEGWCFAILAMIFLYLFALGINYIWNTIWFLITE